MIKLFQCRLNTSAERLDFMQICSLLLKDRRSFIIVLAMFLLSGVFLSAYKVATTKKEFESIVTLSVHNLTSDSLVSLTKTRLFQVMMLTTKLVQSPGTDTVEILQLLGLQSSPIYENLMFMSGRIRATAIPPDQVTLTVKMPDENVATLLADSIGSVLKKLIIRRLDIIQNKEWKNLEVDSVQTITLLMDNYHANIKLVESVIPENLRAIRGIGKSRLKLISVETELAESTYIKALGKLNDFEIRAAEDPDADPFQKKRLMDDVELKYSVYSALYKQLQQTKLSNQFELLQTQLDAERQIGKLNSDLGLQIEKNQQARIQKKLKLISENDRMPSIRVVTPASKAIHVNKVNVFSAPLVMLFLGCIVGVIFVLTKRCFYHDQLERSHSLNIRDNLND